MSYFYAEFEDALGAHRKRVEGLARSDDERSLYRKDGHKIASSLYLIRLQNVSQVDHPTAYMEIGRNNADAWSKQYYNSRLTHTFQVARLAYQIAMRFESPGDDDPDRSVIESYGGVYPEVAEAAAFAHDIGHPPYGHVCETFLARLMRNYGGFEGNAQTLRILTSLNPGARSGINLTRRTFAACIKYPWTYSESLPRGESRQAIKKYSLYDLPLESEGTLPLVGERLLAWVYQGKNGGLDTAPAARIKTPEAEIMDFADDVAYATSDFFEAFPSSPELQDLLSWENFRRFVGGSSDLLESFLKAGLTPTFHEEPSSSIILDKGVEWLDLRTLRDQEVSWAALSFVHALVWSKTGFGSKTTSVTKFILALRLENALKEILMSPSTKVPAVGISMPPDRGHFLAVLQEIPYEECWHDVTFRIVEPYYDRSVGDDVDVFRSAKVGVVARVLLCVLKEAVVFYVHKQGNQRARHIVRGLRCAILLQTLVHRWVDKFEDLTRLAKTIFLDADVDKAILEIQSCPTPLVSQKAIRLKWRFCCDLLASQSEMAIKDLFFDYCTVDDGQTGKRQFHPQAEQAFQAILDENRKREFFGEGYIPRAIEATINVVLNWQYVDHEEVRDDWATFRLLLARPA